MHFVMRCSCPKTLLKCSFKCAHGVEAYIKKCGWVPLLRPPYWFRVTRAYICSCAKPSNIVIYWVIPTLDLEVCTFLVSKSWYCTNYKSCWSCWSLEYTCKAVHGLLSERVLCAHWKDVVCLLKGYYFHIFDMSGRFAVIIVVFCAMLNYKLQLIS